MIPSQQTAKIHTIEKDQHFPVRDLTSTLPNPTDVGFSATTGTHVPVANNTTTVYDYSSTTGTTFPTTTTVTRSTYEGVPIDNVHHDSTLKEKVKEVAHDVKEACGNAAEAVKDKLHDAKVAVAGH
ncbi:unnamed protein product [Caenorhabditis auriculariae]|uniref:Uncharacterized protein n=1 Tax=Caenorhabditis auriculariae TaxID=2777116 RepID=A0A8S1HVH7_9PELO|nr:unnamed protein product [Caenorhabditis auriculariae]